MLIKSLSQTPFSKYLVSLLGISVGTLMSVPAFAQVNQSSTLIQSPAIGQTLVPNTTNGTGFLVNPGISSFSGTTTPITNTPTTAITGTSPSGLNPTTLGITAPATLGVTTNTGSFSSGTTSGTLTPVTPGITTAFPATLTPGGFTTNTGTTFPSSLNSPFGTPVIRNGF
jgi:hypothetical protein